jgi:hypothetical protein
MLPFVRMTWITLFKTKAEVETIEEELVNGIIHSREFFENFVKILEAAEVRIMCAQRPWFSPARRGLGRGVVTLPSAAAGGHPSYALAGQRGTDRRG